MKRISFLTLCLIALLSLTSCLKKISNEAIKEMAAQTNSQCPMPINQIMTMREVKLDDNYFIYNYDVNETIAPIDKLEEMGEIDRDMIIINLIENEEANKLISLMKAAEKTLRFQYKGLNTGKEVVVDVKPSEVEDYDQAKINEVIREKMAKFIELTNANCPMQVDAVTYLDSVALTDDAFCYLYTIDEDKLSMDLLKENVNVLAASVQANSFGENASMSNMVNNCKRIGLTIMFQYEGSKTEDYIQLRLNLDNNTVEVLE